MPSNSFGLLNPGVYTSIFLGSKAAIEPQINLLYVSGGGSSNHVLSAAGQFNYFFSGLARESPYAFVSGGFSDISDSSTTPMSVSAGVGYRTPFGDRLTFRLDGRYIHFTDEGGNALSFGFSIGGVFAS